MSHYLAFFGGLVALVFFADQFVKGSSAIAKIYRIPPVIIGVVLLGFGTSLPESLVSITAARTGDLDIGVGNIIGSNVANLGLVMACAVTFTKILIPRPIISKEGLLTLGSSVALALVLVNESISRMEGCLLLVGGVLVLLYILRNNAPNGPDTIEKVEHKAPTEMFRVACGLAGTVIGAFFTVRGAAGLADSWGITGGFVGFLLIAMGTSLPELVTTVSCARRGETDLIIGNLFGSNIFNCLLVGGLMGIAGPGQISDSTLTGKGLFFMILITVTLLALAINRKPIGKSGGALLFILYLLAAIFLGINSSS